MAADLAGTPTIGVDVQLCGDAHLANFGSFASAERRQVFDVNDFDETLPGPWEWDLKRLAASMVIAARDNGFDDKAARNAAQAAVRSYQDAMAEFADAPALQVWYAQLSLARLREGIPRKSDRKAFDKAAAKAAGKNSQRALGKLTETVDGKTRIRSQPPLLTPVRDLAEHIDPDKLRTAVKANFAGYVDSLPPDRRHVLKHFSIVDMALKVVGVGSVGTRCWIVLLEGRDQGEPLFLQIKEATASVLEAHLPASEYEHPGQRVVNGRRLMQASSDMFLGWSGTMDGGHYYWRQFHDIAEAELRQGGELADLRDVASKAAENVARLAALFHVFQHGPDGSIGPDHVQAAARIVSWHLLEARRFLGDAAIPKATRNAMKLDGWLIARCQESGSEIVLLRDVMRLGPNPVRRKADAEQALAELADAGRAVLDKDHRIIRVNPALLEG